MHEEPKQRGKNWSTGISSTGFPQNKPSILQIPDDPILSFTFLLESPAVNSFFSEMINLGSENEIIEHTIVGEFGEVVQKIPGKLQYYSLILKRGLTSNRDLAIWRKLVEDGTIESARVDATLTVLDQEGAQVAAWDLEQCWPSAIEVVYSAESIIMEQITIVMDSMLRTS